MGLERWGWGGLGWEGAQDEGFVEAQGAEGSMGGGQGRDMGDGQVWIPAAKPSIPYSQQGSDLRAKFVFCCVV